MKNGVRMEIFSHVTQKSSSVAHSPYYIHIIGYCIHWVLCHTNLPQCIGESGDQSPIELATRIASSSPPTKDGRASDSCFVLIGTHQCDVLMDGLQLMDDFEFMD